MSGPPVGAVALVDVQRLLSLFTQGLGGRYMHLKPTEALTGEFRPEGATTDGRTIYLPASVATFTQPRHNLGVYRISVLHQLGFFEHGTFAFSLATARTRLPSLPADPPLQPQQAVPPDLERFFALWGAPALMRRLFMTLEDLRIDSAMARRYPGARADLRRVLAHALAHRPAMPDALGQPVPALVESLVRYTLEAPAAELVAGDPSGRLADLLAMTARLRDADADVHDTALVAVAWLRAMAGLMHRRAEAAPHADARVSPDTADHPPPGPAATRPRPMRARTS